MSSVALVSYDVQTVEGRAGGVASFLTHFARLLKDRGENVTIIRVDGSPQPRAIDREWQEQYAAWGIELRQVNNVLRPEDAWFEAWPARLSQQLVPHLRGFDIVYLQDWANPGFQSIRRRRFSGGAGPMLVTVLHGPSEWIRSGNRKLPNVPEDLHMRFMERYSAEHSDWVIAPSKYIAAWLKREGWNFKREPEVMGLPYVTDGSHEIPAGIPTIERIVFFGRLEIRKGFDIFQRAIRLLWEEDPQALNGLKEVVLLGQEQEMGSAEQLRRTLQTTGLRVIHLPDLDSAGANAYLKAHVASALVVVPSPFENFPYTVIETLMIPGLNVICSRGGGIPELFGHNCDAQLFEPTAPSLARKVRERLGSPLSADKLAVYDAGAANARWLELHDRLCARQRTGAARFERPTVDVCITYYNKGQYLAQLLRALSAQTERRFGVIAIDDGSTDPASQAAFDDAAKTYGHLGWRFVRQQNAFVDAARNAAARLSSADYLLFIDADDVPTTCAIKKLMDGVSASGVDCLLCGGYFFDSEAMPYDLSSGVRMAQGVIEYMPLGPDLVCGMVDPMVLGLPAILIRSAVFEKIGGYRECRGAGHEDWEMQIRMLIAGYKTDVLPEYLLYFRRMADGLTKTGDSYLAKMRLIESYKSLLRLAGLSGLAEVALQLNQQCLELQGRLKENIPLELRLQYHRSQQQRR